MALREGGTPRTGNRSKTGLAGEKGRPAPRVGAVSVNDGDGAEESSSPPLATQQDSASRVLFSAEHINSDATNEPRQTQREDDVDASAMDDVEESTSIMVVGGQSTNCPDDAELRETRTPASNSKVLGSANGTGGDHHASTDDTRRNQSRNTHSSTATFSSFSTIQTSNVNRKRKKKKTTAAASEVERKNRTIPIRDKRGRPTRVATIAEVESDSKTTTSFPPLPGNQYTATLRRRAVRKIAEQSPMGIFHTNSGQKGELDDLGDISLGMKLIVVGGRVIVESLNPLADGLASPAQLAGVIQRGDVLLAVGNVSLVNLPVDLLMEGLRPLSTPGPGGYYQRFLDLRFEAATGFRLLKAHEEVQERSNARQEPENAMFSLFPMVDQLSGAPLFDQQYSREEADHADEGNELAVEEASLEGKLVDSSDNHLNVHDIDALISSALADERSLDRRRYESEYFDWREDLSELLRRTVGMVNGSDDDTLTKLTKSERLELGKKIMQVTKALEINMEEIDRGRDLRSFKAWSTNFSLRSGVSARRRYIMDNTSRRSSRVTDKDSDDESKNSDYSSGTLEGVDADTLLLGLAARDEIWRKQVVDVLNSAAESLASENFAGETDESFNSGQERGSSGIDDAMKNQLGNFLFGQNMSKIVKQENRSFALPPKEITRVLFDLTTNLATKTPDELTVFGTSSKLSSNISSLQSSVKTDGKARAAVRADVLLANRFVLDEALPRWLKAFRPLPLEHRRTMWPPMNRRIDLGTGPFTGNPSEFTGRLSDGDSLTLDSGGSNTQNTSSPSRKKDLRELVEGQQIDGETRSETCFLVTYFYTRKILSDEPGGTRPSMDADEFVAAYGSYLELHSCLTFAGSMGDESAIAALLKAADNDPTHRDAVKEIQKSNDFLFYDSSKLSAVLQFLTGIRYNMKAEKRKAVRDLCVSAYPDIQPWQVRKACLDPPRQALDALERRPANSDEEMENLYYTYMSHLLNPLDGHEDARHDAELVKEYCEWSIGIAPRPNNRRERLKNFIAIASRSSIQYKRYRRDLLMLLDQSMIIGKEDLALDLAGEVLDNTKLLSNNDALSRVLTCLRKIGVESLATITNPATEAMGFRVLRRVLKLFERMATSDSMTCRKSIVASDELYTIFQDWKIQSGSGGDDSKMYIIIDFVVDESSAPGDVLQALMNWSSSNETGESLFPRLRSLLRRGVHYAALTGELSGTLLRLKRARNTFTELVLSPDDRTNAKSSSGIWERMATGDLAMDK